MPKPITKFLLFLFFVPTFSLCLPAKANDQGGLDALRAVIENRLKQMADVARYKWDHSIAVEDKEREAAILVRTVNQAGELGIESGAANRLVIAQMTAAKMIQNRLIARWNAKTAEDRKLPPLRDLSTEIRPVISKLTQELLTSVKALEEELLSCSAHIALAKNRLDSVTNAEWHTAIEGLKPTGLACNQ